MKRKLKYLFLGIAILIVFLQIGVSLDKVELDEFGNTCYGNVIKVCKEG